MDSWGFDANCWLSWICRNTVQQLCTKEYFGNEKTFYLSFEVIHQNTKFTWGLIFVLRNLPLKSVHSGVTIHRRLRSPMYTIEHSSPNRHTFCSSLIFLAKWISFSFKDLCGPNFHTNHVDLCFVLFQRFCINCSLPTLSVSRLFSFCRA